MINVAEAPDFFLSDSNELTMFLGGGISNTADWQNEYLRLFAKETARFGPSSSHDLRILNPRRRRFDPDLISMRQQIEWEYAAMESSDLIIFWFSPETLCPITLFELGRWSYTDKPLVVGIDPDYKREWDVRMQLDCIDKCSDRPETIQVVMSLEALVTASIEELEELLNVE